MVKDNDLIEAFLCCLKTFKTFFVDPFAFQNTVHPFCNSLLIQIALFSHVDANPIIGQQFHIFFRTILASSVRVMD